MKGWIASSLIFFITGGVLIGKGIDRFKNYYQSDTYSDLDKYALVGGDAYNYIINTNIMNGYFIMAATSLLIGIVLVAIGVIIHILKKNHERLISAYESSHVNEQTTVLDTHE